MTRRQGIGAAAMTALSYRQVLGANDRLRGALVGCGNRGVNALLRVAVTRPEVEMVAACDVYKANLDKALTMIGGKGGRADAYVDYRKVIERKDIDVVFVGTPDHWHAPITVAACAAGKDVYVEKPLANDIEECRQVVDASEKYKRLVQVGVQQRSLPIYFEALKLIQDGAIGPVKRCVMVWGSDGGPRGDGPGSRPMDDETAVPDGLDWEAFQGSSPRLPYRSSRQRSWRSYWEYGSGVITDFGVHLLDVTHWFMGIDTPLSAYGTGYHSPGRRPEMVPDVVALTWRYEKFLATYFSSRDTWGNTFWGDEGTLHVNRSGLTLKSFARGAEPKFVKAPSSGNGDEHIVNFLECVKSRKQPNAHAEIGARSTIACLLAAMSVKTGRAWRYDWAGRKASAV